MGKMLAGLVLPTEGCSGPALLRVAQWIPGTLGGRENMGGQGRLVLKGV